DDLRAAAARAFKHLHDRRRLRLVATAAEPRRRGRPGRAMLERSPAESLRMTRRPTGRPPGRPVKAAVVKAATAVAAPPLVGAGMLLSFDVRPRSALRRVAFGPRPMIDVRAHVPRPLHDE